MIKGHGSWEHTCEIMNESSKINPNSVDGAMAGDVRQRGEVEVQVVGAGALNQAIKAVAIARGYVSSAGLDLVCTPTFADIEIDGQDRTGIHLLVESRRRGDPVDLRADGNGRAARNADGNGSTIPTDR